MIDQRQLLVALLLRDLDAPLDAADRFEVLGELRAIAGRQACRPPMPITRA
jgi:hypothetical protein